MKEKREYIYSGLGFWERGGSLSGKTSVEWLRKAVKVAEDMHEDEVMLYVFRNETGKGPEFRLMFGKTNKSLANVEGRIKKLTFGGVQ